jgi:hypothetical protein
MVFKRSSGISGDIVRLIACINRAIGRCPKQVRRQNMSLLLPEDRTDALQAVVTIEIGIGKIVHGDAGGILRSPVFGFLEVFKG